jgi:leucyl/phenylalanyl-tRNA--protein transferase
MQVVLTPELLIEAYRQGLFPMAYDAGSPYVHWICPEERGQLSIPAMHIPRSLGKMVRNQRNFSVKVNTDFPAVIHECAQLNADRPETWINENIINAYIKLHRQGHAHSVECWQEIDGEEQLVGGLYGIAIGGAFFGESMFSRVPNASKIALVHLVARLWKGGYRLLDTQFVNDHLLQFGIYELEHEAYMGALAKTIDLDSDFALEGLSEYQIIKSYFEMRALKA